MCINVPIIIAISSTTKHCHSKANNGTKREVFPIQSHHHIDILVIKLQFSSIYLLQQVRCDELDAGMEMYDNNHELR